MSASTGAGNAVGLVIQELLGELHSFAVRAPVPTASVVDLTEQVVRERSVDEIKVGMTTSGVTRTGASNARTKC